MKLHANAALSLNKRRQLCRACGRAGWSLTEAAEAAGVSESTARKWVRRYRAEGEAGPARSLLGSARSADATPRSASQAIAALRRLRMTAPRSPSCWRCRSRPSRGSSPGSGSASSPGSSRPSRPTATSASGPGELIHIDVKKLGRIEPAPGTG